MVPKDFKKPQCVLAGWVTLIVAVLWEIAIIYSIGVFDCAWSFFGIDNGITTWSMLYVTYFMGGCKSPSDASTIGFFLTPPTTPAQNLQIWLWIFCIVTLLWIPACFTLIIAASSEVRGRAGSLLYYPWVCVTSLLIILDLAAAVYHFVDVFSTTTVDDYASLTYNTNWSSLTSNASSDGITSWLPSFYLTLFFWRFLALWLLNGYFLYTVSTATRAVALYHTKYLQPTLMTAEKSKTWRDKFFKGLDPREIPQQSVNTISAPNFDDSRGFTQEMQERSPRSKSPVMTPLEKQQARKLSDSSFSSTESTHNSPVRYELDVFGIPIRELRGLEVSDSPDASHQPRSPLPSTSQSFDYPAAPRSRPQSFIDRWKEVAPPIAGGVEVPPELNKNRPFSYTAGDQPQFMRKAVSRSNSRAEYPVIPRPDYTVADRHVASLDYVPHRFKVPSHVRHLESSGSFNYDKPSTSSHSPTSPRRATGLKKSHIYPRTVMVGEDVSTLPQAKYLAQQDIPSQQQTLNTSKSTQSSSAGYDINKLY